MSNLLFQLLGFGCWSVFSFCWVELMRDLWHLACHRNAALYRWFHKFHHTAYDFDFRMRSEEAWRRSQWRHGLPESFVMLLGTLILVFPATLFSHSWAIAGISFGVFRAVREMVLVVLHILGRAKETDHLHQEVQSESPPSHWTVNRSYHWRHHYEHSLAYYSGVYPWLDEILGTALSFKRKRIAIMNMDSPFGMSLAERFKKEGATVIEAISEDSLDSVDILVTLNSDQNLLCLFLKTVQSNRDIACKEIWWINPSPQQSSFPALLEGTTLCTVRRISILTPPETPMEVMVGQIFFQAKRHVSKIIVAKDPLIVLLYWLNFVVNGLWLNYTQPYQRTTLLTTADDTAISP